MRLRSLRLQRFAYAGLRLSVMPLPLHTIILATAGNPVPGWWPGLLGASLRLTLRAPVGREKSLRAIFSNKGSESNPLSPPSIKKAPVRGLIYGWRRERDSNPRYAVSVYTLSRRAPSTTRTPLREFRLLVFDNIMSYRTTEHSCVLVTPGSCPAPLRGQLTKFAVPNRSRRFGQPLGHLSNVRF